MSIRNKNENEMAAKQADSQPWPRDNLPHGPEDLRFAPFAGTRLHGLPRCRERQQPGMLTLRKRPRSALCMASSGSKARDASSRIGNSTLF